MAVELAPELLEVLACPNCHGSLAVDHERSELVCTSPDCRLAYPVRDQIPILLIDEARPPKGANPKDPEPTKGPEQGAGPETHPAKDPEPTAQGPELVEGPESHPAEESEPTAKDPEQGAGPETQAGKDSSQPGSSTNGSN